MDSQTKKQIQDFISNAKYEKAVGAFITWADVNGDSDLQNALRMKKGELSTLKNDINMGMVDSRDEGVRRNKIVAGLLGMLSDAEDMASPTTSPASTQPVNTPITVATVNNNANNGLKTILFMGANPPGVRSLQLDVEHSRIAAELNGISGITKFNLPTEKFLSIDQMPDLIIQHKPYILHFSGHGKNPESGEHGETSAVDMSRAIGRLPKDYGQKGGIVTFSENMLDLEIVDDDKLEFLFQMIVQSIGIPIEVVVFNSCYSESQAKAIGKYVPFIVGTANAIKDNIAIAFATGFYFGLAQGLTIEKAYASGRIQAVLKDFKAKDLIVLYKNGERQQL